MPGARESLLRAADAALSARPWPAVRMIETAATAGVSRQTLYNEFGDKEGLGRALVRRAAEGYLDGVDRVLAPAGAGGPDPGPGEVAGRLAGLALWTVGAARARPLVRALLTGCWDADLPVPPPPGSRQALGPGELARAVRDRAAAALASEPPWRCELAVRLALSYVSAPEEEQGTGELLRLLGEGLGLGVGLGPAAGGGGGAGLSATSRTAGAR
ncbi:TetR/AcrR family transcriptional regulator [Streptomyces sp. NPDC087917]|uniref:TetR/AcrR family transcriptional regulator n=1 Tax=unclassified Streptomyces TaxID=2593676 RepID=UPI0034147871